MIDIVHIIYVRELVVKALDVKIDFCIGEGGNKHKEQPE